VHDERGAACIPLGSGLLPWPAAALAPETAELNGVRARVMPLDPLARGKQQARDDPADAAKDAVDADVLAQVLRDRDR
jgi:hypothetical protein